MTQQHPYCRTCGSHIKKSDVCNYCGCEPLKGTNYCCDCGTSTVTGAIMCVHCGASFQRRFPATLAILISIALAVSFIGTAYYLTHNETESSEKIAGVNATEKNNDSIFPDKTESGKKNEAFKTITNNIPVELLKKDDPIDLLTKKLPKNPKPIEVPDPVITKPITPKKNTEEIIPPSEDKATTSSGRVSVNGFSGREMRGYTVGCTYFEGRSKNNVVFFTTNVYGYVKVNGKVYALQGLQKGNDIARFAGAGYEVTIEILGLAGNENEWLAEATMVVKDIRQKTLSRHKIYSTCTDF